MKLYFAGAESLSYHKLLASKGVQRKLVSYFYVKGKNPQQHFVFKDMFLDSGAFTAFTNRTVIDIDEYIEFIKKHSKSLNAYSNLDVIGNNEGSLRNYDYMVAKGVKPLPVFQKSNSYEYLRKYLERTDYIAIGGMVGTSAKALTPFLDNCFSIIKEYWPKKVHGFGLTSPELLERYPFYSADSTSWLGPARFGGVLRYADGRIKKSNSDYDIILAKSMDYKGLVLKAIDSFLSLEDYITKLWKQRGIEW